MSEKRIRVTRKNDLPSRGTEGTGRIKNVSAPGILTLHSVIGARGDLAECDIVFRQSAYRDVMRHLASDTTREQGGLLCGYEVMGSSGPIVLVNHALPAAHTQGTPARLVMPHETWVEFDRQLDAVERHGMIRRVGWYHSHPNIEIFLSQWDLEVCTLFPRPLHVALVVDPVRKMGAFFVRGQGGFQPHRRQGFWEDHDLEPASIVSWTNLTSGSAVSAQGKPRSDPEGSGPIQPLVTAPAAASTAADLRGRASLAESGATTESVQERPAPLIGRSPERPLYGAARAPSSREGASPWSADAEIASSADEPADTAPRERDRPLQATFRAASEKIESLPGQRRVRSDTVRIHGDRSRADFGYEKRGVSRFLSPILALVLLVILVIVLAWSNWDARRRQEQQRRDLDAMDQRVEQRLDAIERRVETLLSTRQTRRSSSSNLSVLPADGVNESSAEDPGAGPEPMSCTTATSSSSEVAP